MIEFFMPMKPPTATHQMQAVRVVNGKPIFYEPDKVAAARQKLTDHLGEHTPPTPLTGPLRLVTKWCFPLVKGKRDGQWKDTKPDTDNLIKLLKDCMTTLGFWADDAKVASEITEKFWAAIPGIYVRVEELS